MPLFLSDAEIEHIGRALLGRSLPKVEWTHAAHFAAAVWLLRQPEIHADRDMPRMIRAYNEAAGVPNTDTSGYHETITLGLFAGCPRVAGEPARRVAAATILSQRTASVDLNSSSRSPP